MTSCHLKKVQKQVRSPLAPSRRLLGSLPCWSRFNSERNQFRSNRKTLPNKDTSWHDGQVRRASGERALAVGARATDRMGAEKSGEAGAVSGQCRRRSSGAPCEWLRSEGRRPGAGHSQRGLR